MIWCLFGRHGSRSTLGKLLSHGLDKDKRNWFDIMSVLVDVARFSWFDLTITGSDNVKGRTKLEHFIVGGKLISKIDIISAHYPLIVSTLI